MNEKHYPDPAEKQHREARQSHWDAIARKRDSWRGMGLWYHRRIEQIYRFLISPGQRVLEIGSGTGNLLAAVRPGTGWGLIFRPRRSARARQRYPEIEFIQADAHDLSAIEGTFDVIILSDLINELWDVQQVLEQIKPLCTSRTRIIINFYSRSVGSPPSITQLLNLATPTLAQNWLTHQDVTNMLNLAGFETVRSWQEVLWPLPLGGFFNKFLVRFWPFKRIRAGQFFSGPSTTGKVNEEAGRFGHCPGPQ
jgi:ubiquinone/menaquinone biosynthesis C-methylase UbiE